MAKTHVLFLVHGMGKPNDSTFAKWESKLAAHYTTYASAGDTFDALFKCVKIDYDEELEKIRKVWSNEIDRLYGAMSAETATLTALPDKSALAALTDDSFFTTYVMDVLTYRFTPQVRQAIRDIVCGKIAAEITQGGNPPGTDYSIVAYSLGTAVAHDSVNHMYSTSVGDKVFLNPTEFRFHAIAQLANVSRTLETTYDAYEPLVLPGIDHSSGDRYATTRMLSASHAWDPLVSLRRFKPVANWPDSETVAAKRFALVEPSIIQHWNVHALEHYLDDPNVHIPLFRMLRTKGFVSQSAESKAQNRFNISHPIEQYKQHRDELKKLLTGEADFTWKRLVEIIESFGDLIESFGGN